MEFFFLSVKAIFDVDPRSKKTVLSSAAAKWKQFKSRLSTRHIIPFKNNPEILRKPPSVYNFITHKEWEGFVALRLSAKYLVSCCLITGTDLIKVKKRKKYCIDISQLY